MKKFLKPTLIICFLLSGLNLISQIPNGTWRDHLPYSNVRRLAEVNNKIFCATSGGLFSYNKTDNSLEKYSKVNGLADIGITALEYSENLQILVIGYENGNIDIIKQNLIINIPDIKRKLIVGDKRINNIYFIDGYAYLACGFGVVVVDVQKMEIKDTYLFGPGGSQIYVYDITFDGENILAATIQGIFYASLSSPNLVDYNYWNKKTVLPDENATYQSIVYFGGKLLATYQNPVTSRSEIIEITTDNWSLWSPEQLNYRILDTQKENLIIVSDYLSQVYNNNLNVIYQKGTYLPQFALFDKDQILWIADRENGLIRSLNDGLDKGIYPNGPQFFDVGKIVYLSGNLWVGSGGTGSNRYDQKGAYLYKNEQWTSINRETLPDLEGFHSISEIAINPSNPDHVFVGSVGSGIAEITGNSATIYDETNSVFETIEGYGHGYIFVTGMSFDQRNNLWVCTNFAQNPIYVRRADGTLENVKLKFNGFGINTRVNGIYVTKAGQIWLLMERTGILVFRENQNGTFSEKFFTVINQEGKLLDRLYSIAEDNDGNVWIGTSNGPVVYFNPVGIIEETRVISGNQVLIPRNDESGLGDFLLKDERIFSITIDGANRKWFGTEKSGVFLMSADGKKEIHHFNSENSPLFSDNMISIAINDDNGEIFFGTDKGIQSFKGQATRGDDDYRNVYVYPNPVRENYRGDITITGLAANVNVKITDISGNLVFETTALGGQAIWDGTNFRGERVHTGVYLVFCTDDEGARTHVTKLLFIR